MCNVLEKSISSTVVIYLMARVTGELSGLRERETEQYPRSRISHSTFTFERNSTEFLIKLSYLDIYFRTLTRRREERPRSVELFGPR